MRVAFREAALPFAGKTIGRCQISRAPSAAPVVAHEHEKLLKMKPSVQHAPVPADDRIWLVGEHRPPVLPERRCCMTGEQARRSTCTLADSTSEYSDSDMSQSHIRIRTSLFHSLFRNLATLLPEQETAQASQSLAQALSPTRPGVSCPLHAGDRHGRWHGSLVCIARAAKVRERNQVG